MKQQNRRKFLLTSSLIGVTLPALAKDKKIKNQVIHHVFFWLKNPGSAEDKQKLIAGLQSLESIDVIKKMHIGVPASTETRPVVDNSFDVSEIMFFDSEADQKIYQDHALHQHFVNTCSHLWQKVIVYDVSDVK